MAKTQVSSAQLWVLLLGQILFLIWLLALKKVQVWVMGLGICLHELSLYPLTAYHKSWLLALQKVQV